MGVRTELTSEENSWIDKLCSSEYGQSHIIDDHELFSSTDSLKRLLAQIEAADKGYPGGLLQYIKRARKLLNDSKEGINTFEGYTPEVPLGISLNTDSAEFAEYESAGLAELSGVAFVLVAGGLGERLGYRGIKVALPVETLTGMTYMELYIRMVLACESFAASIDGCRPKLPLCIMTSDDTHALTEQLLRDHDCFGLPQDQIVIVKQEKVPAFIDSEARIAVKKNLNDNLILETKPHGHGDIHSLLHQHKLPKKWKQEGRKWIIFFQDTNALVSHALLPLLGVSKKLNLTMNSLAVARTPGEAVGALCKLTKEGKPSLTINIEYNLLQPLLASHKRDDEPSVVNGYSRFPGNTNILLMNLERYEKILIQTGGTVPEFVNPKYADCSKTTFKSATRLECMMQDLPLVFDPEDRVGFTQLERWLCFSTVKNNVVDAISKIQQGLPADCAFTGEADFYHANAMLLKIAAKYKCNTFEVAEPKPATYLGVDYKMGPRVVMLPSFALGLCQVKNRLKGGKLEITAESGVILDGEINVDGLSVIGGLILKAQRAHTLSVKNLNVVNTGFRLRKLLNDETDPCLLIRGYRFECADVSVICG